MSECGVDVADGIRCDLNDAPPITTPNNESLCISDNVGCVALRT
jgi:hypothetical protein